MTAPSELDHDTVFKAVVAALEEILGQDLDEVTSETRLMDELGLDSTGVLGVLITLEDTLGIEIDPDNITEEYFETLGGLVQCAENAAKGS